MINTKFKAKERDTISFNEIIPEGWYECEITKVADWKSVEKTLAPFSWDDNYQKELDENGNPIKLPAKKYTVSTLNFVLKITDGTYKGATVFGNVTDHPNMPWSIPHLMSQTGITEADMTTLPKLLLGRKVKAKIIVDTYDKKVVDKDTGFEETVKTEVNRVRDFKKSSMPQPTSEVPSDDLPQF